MAPRVGQETVVSKANALVQQQQSDETMTRPLGTALMSLPPELQVLVYGQLPSILFIMDLKRSNTVAGVILRENSKTIALTAYGRLSRANRYDQLWHGTLEDFHLPINALPSASREDRKIRALELYDHAAMSVLEFLHELLWPDFGGSFAVPDDDGLLDMILMLMPVTASWEDFEEDEFSKFEAYYTEISRLPAQTRQRIRNSLVAVSQACLRLWQASDQTPIWLSGHLHEIDCSGLLAYTFLPGIISCLVEVFHEARQSSLDNNDTSTATENPLLALVSDIRRKIINYFYSVFQNARFLVRQRKVECNNFVVELFGSRCLGWTLLKPYETANDPENGGVQYHLTKLTRALDRGSEFDAETYDAIWWSVSLEHGLDLQQRENRCCWEWDMALYSTIDKGASLESLARDGDLGLKSLFLEDGYLEG